MTVLLNKSQWVILVLVEIISGWIYWTQWMESLCRVDSGKRQYCGETIGGRVCIFLRQSVDGVCIMWRQSVDVVCVMWRLWIESVFCEYNQWIESVFYGDSQ